MKLNSAPQRDKQHKKIKEALDSFSKEDISRVSAAIGISSNEISRVLRELV